jgi:hypothetical protein
VRRLISNGDRGIFSGSSVCGSPLYALRLRSRELVGTLASVVQPRLAMAGFGKTGTGFRGVDAAVRENTLHRSTAGLGPEDMAAQWPTRKSARATPQWNSRVRPSIPSENVKDWAENLLACGMKRRQIVTLFEGQE